MKSTLQLILLCCVLVGCRTMNQNADVFDKALENGRLANESYVRSLRCMKAWMDQRDSVSGLIPSNLMGKKDLWEPFNAAADNYAFMVLTAYLLDRDLYHGPMLDMLRSEEKLTSRIRSMPDVYRFSTRTFDKKEVDTTWIIFGTSEYIKDGLIPLTEYIGPSPWTIRMMNMLEDLSDYYSVFKNIQQVEAYKAVSEEVNGSMLQALSRIYHMTGNEKYLDWAIRIGDYYLLGERDLTRVEYLRLRDHGCEIIGGLSELYVTLHDVKPEKKDEYRDRYYRLLDRILETGRNEDGLFYNAVNTLTGAVADSGIVDNWGYIFDAYYTVYLTDKKTEYRQAFLDGISRLNENYRNFAWEGKSHDGYADALESAINLYNREPVPALKDWINSEMKVMWGMQKESGIIGGGHPDGNFERTAIMYALWKTMGIHCNPWRQDLHFGAEMKNGTLYIALTAKKSWQGTLTFDFPRHREILNLPIDYPRINQFPEWFTVLSGKEYIVSDISAGTKSKFTGKDLKYGIPLSLEPGDARYLTVKEQKR